jgi:hypothetical protein
VSAESEGDVVAELGTNCNLEKTIALVCPAWRCPHQTRLKWKLASVRLDIVLILMQGMRLVCTEHTIGSEIILAAPNGTPR